MNRVARRDRLTAALAERDLAGFLVTTPTERALPDRLHRLERRRLPGHGEARFLTDFRYATSVAPLARRLAGRDRRAEPARATSPRRIARALRRASASASRPRRSRTRPGTRWTRPRARPAPSSCRATTCRGSARRQGRRRDRADPRRRRGLRRDLRLAGRGGPGRPRGARGGLGDRAARARARRRRRVVPADRRRGRQRRASRTPCPAPLEIERSTLVVLDLGALVGGYCSDCTRTFATGPSEPQMMDVYETVLRRTGGRARARPARAGLPARCTRRRGA